MFLLVGLMFNPWPASLSQPLDIFNIFGGKLVEKICSKHCVLQLQLRITEMISLEFIPLYTRESESIIAILFCNWEKIFFCCDILFSYSCVSRHNPAYTRIFFLYKNTDLLYLVRIMPPTLIYDNNPSQ